MLQVLYHKRLNQNQQNQMLLLVSVLIALFLMSTKEGKKVAKDVSKSVSSVAGQKGKGGFPSGLVLLLEPYF